MIEIYNAEKKFDIRQKLFSPKMSLKILKGINLSINDGEIVSLLGMNGSGKTTLLKCISGVISLSKGEILIDKKNSFEFRKQLTHDYGVLFSNKHSFIEDVTIKDNFQLFKTVYGISQDKFIVSLANLDSFFDLRSLMNLQYRKLSFGQRMRCEIASILIHNPKYLILDEPTVGLDAYYKENLKKCLRYYNDHYNTTIVFTTHELDFLENLTQMVLVIDDGRIIYNNSYKKFQNMTPNEKYIEVYYNDILSSTEEVLGISEDTFIDNDKIIITIKNSKDESEILEKLFKNVSIKKLEIYHSNLKKIIEGIVDEKVS
jgi:ABC-2 type transport system ATP-binding protein